MGFLDDLGGKLNRGAEITARTGKNIKLKAQLAEKKAQRNAACARLGEAVFNESKADSARFDDLKDQISAIAEIDDAIEAIQSDLDKIAEDAAASARSYVTGTCPTCGYRPNQGDAYCSRCGSKIPDQDGFAQDDPFTANGAPIDVEPVEEEQAQQAAASEKPAWARNIPTE
ncbi:MAG: hypothetical protein ACI4B9_00215 [Eggerthellaceae bacterium]